MKSKVLFVLLSLSALFLAWSVYNLKIASNRAKMVSEQWQQPVFSRNSEVIIKKAGQLILLPQDERPSAAVINNVSRLQKNQPFYKDARNGDWLLIYFKARKVYIYSESKNIIVSVGPLALEKINSVNPNDASASSTTSTVFATSTR